LFFIFLFNPQAICSELNGKIVFSTQHELCIINLELKETWKSPIKIPLPFIKDIASNPEWMPNNDKIIFEYQPLKPRMKRHIAILDIKTKKVIAMEGNLFYESGNLFFPNWSPNGRLLAFLKYKKLEMNKDKTGLVTGIRHFYKLIITDKSFEQYVDPQAAYATRSPISWSADNNKIAFTTSDQHIAIYDLEKNKSFILEKGTSPLFNPLDGLIYYIAQDNHLYKIGVGKDPKIIDRGDWSWLVLLGFSNDGDNLFFIERGSFLLWEYSTINVFNLSSQKRKRISKKYAILHGAAFTGKGGQSHNLLSRRKIKNVKAVRP
ncbi:hypothetical protein ACFL9T_17700, partial [Thermodesulfobacteriota bacterium]